MRRAATFLLLMLLLPGLLLPAGMLLHVCRCAAPMQPDARTCCERGPIDESSRPRSCCHSDDAPTSPNDGMPRAGDDACGCVWLPLPENPEDQAPPSAVPFVLAAAMPPVARVVEWPWAHRPETSTGCTTQCRPPPPPGRERNLPLRL